MFQANIRLIAAALLLPPLPCRSRQAPRNVNIPERKSCRQPPLAAAWSPSSRKTPTSHGRSLPCRSRVPSRSSWRPSAGATITAFQRRQLAALLQGQRDWPACKIN